MWRSPVRIRSGPKTSFLLLIHRQGELKQRAAGFDRIIAHFPAVFLYDIFDDKKSRSRPFRMHGLRPFVSEKFREQGADRFGRNSHSAVLDGKPERVFVLVRSEEH